MTTRADRTRHCNALVVTEIRRRRAGIALSQRVFARSIAVCYKTLQHWEWGTSEAPAWGLLMVRAWPESGRSREELNEVARVKIIELRKSVGLSQYDVAAIYQVDRTTILNWEHGRSRIPAWYLVALELESAAERKAA